MKRLSPRLGQLFAIFIGLSLVAFSVSADAATTRVEIVIDEPYANRSVAWPVTTGIPFPRGQLSSEMQCRLVDDRGKEQLLQSRIAATWDAHRNSIRWLTIDFIAQPNRKYWLEFGIDVRRAEFDSSLTIKQDDVTHVSTGAIQAEFSRSGASALAAICADLNGDGVVSPDECVVEGDEAGDHFYINQQGLRFSSAGDKLEREIVVEAKGPVRACVRVDGFYAGTKGEPIVRYRSRYHLFNGLGLIKVINEFKIVGSTKQTQFHDIGIALKLKGDAKNRRVITDASGKEGNQIVSAEWKSDTKSVTSFQETYRHFGNPKCRGAVVEVNAAGERTVQESEHVGEWMQVVDDRVAVTGSLRGFWQQFPKQWEVTQNRMILHLWSPRGGVLDFGADGLRNTFGEAGNKYILDWKGVRGTLSPISNFFYFAGHKALVQGDVDGKGINKHHEFYFHVAPAAQEKAGQEYGRLAAKPPLALATGQWNCSTDVFGPLAARPNDSKYEAIVDRIFHLGQKAQDDFGDYGWWIYGSGPHYSYQWDKETQKHFADPRRFEYHTYQKETQLWWCYLRSGERKFHDWAFPSENHWVDIATTHVPLEYECDWRGGFRQNQTLQFRPGDWSIDSAMFYVRQRDSAEAWLRGGSQYWASYHRTLETTTLAYYLTGDERYNDVLNYWRDYWADLAGKTSRSPDLKPWFREQPWYVRTEQGEPTKTWAEMIRDYAPFTSGLRHQMTQFFNLATLYEHTWDPQIGQALKECTDAYLDPEHPIGVWRTQENGLPNHAEAPLLCHFWVPALWRYERATSDPRMKDIFTRYFDACYAADPFRENIGNYSQVHLAYAYYYTRDPRHLRPAQIELDNLMQFAEPLARPEDLGKRLYNPYAPIHSLTATPRLVWALNEAKRNGVSVSKSPPLKPQRSAIALEKLAGQPLQTTLWGYDRSVSLIGTDGKPYRDFKITTKQYASDIQPFDRNVRNFEVYMHELTIPTNAAAGLYILAPTLEMSVLDANGSVFVNASKPIAIESQESCTFIIPSDCETLQIQSANPASLAITNRGGQTLDAKVTDNINSVSIPPSLHNKPINISNIGRRSVWFQVINQPLESCWVTFDSSWGRFSNLPFSIGERQVRKPAPRSDTPESDAVFAKGRFGNAVQITPNRELHLPDHVIVDGQPVRLFDIKQGTIEFWIKKQWDDRIVSTKPVTFLSNGLLQAWSPWKLPLNEWAHVAVEWRPLKRDPNRQAVHIYVNGHDQQNYRSTWWEGYSQKPRTFRTNQEWTKRFLCTTQPGAPFIIDELRISAVPRYANLEVELGGQQTFNPSRFDPPTEQFKMEQHTLLLFPFDDNLIGRSAKIRQELEGRIHDRD